MNASSEFGSFADSVSDTCFTVGPYNVEKNARGLAERISQAGLAVQIKRQQTDRLQKYLVFLPQLPSREAAEEVVKDIQQHKINEFQIIDSGPYKNAIALGTFNDLDKARRHTEYVRFLGYDAKHTAQKQRATVYWVSYDDTFGRQSPVLEWSRLIDPKAVVQKISENCEY
ncbi:MAG: SPOR domain-containing protein [Leucothrix sp.]